MPYDFPERADGSGGTCNEEVVSTRLEVSSTTKILAMVVAVRALLNFGVIFLTEIQRLWVVKARRRQEGFVDFAI